MFWVTVRYKYHWKGHHLLFIGRLLGDQLYTIETFLSPWRSYCMSKESCPGFYGAFYIKWIRLLGQYFWYNWQSGSISLEEAGLSQDTSRYCNCLAKLLRILTNCENKQSSFLTVIKFQMAKMLFSLIESIESIFFASNSFVFPDLKPKQSFFFSSFQHSVAINFVLIFFCIL